MSATLLAASGSSVGDFRLVLVDFDLIEDRVVLHLLLDAFLQRHERQLQDLHRLDHPRCKHLLLSQSAFVGREIVASKLLETARVR